MTDHATRAREILDQFLDATDGEPGHADYRRLRGSIADALEQAAQEAVKAERERCAAVCEYTELRFEVGWLQSATKIELSREVANRLAANIRQGKPAQAAQPVWSAKKPTVAGGYWWRYGPDDETPFPALVYWEDLKG